MSIIQGNSIESGVSTYQIERSLRFNSADSAYLSRTPASSGTTTKWTVSFWVKRSTLGTDQALFSAGNDPNGNYWFTWFNSSNQLYTAMGIPGSNPMVATTTAVFRDVGAFYHLVFAYDSTQATTSDRFKIYVNGVFLQGFGPAQNTVSYWNSNLVQQIGKHISSSTYLNGYITEFHNIDGSALDPTSFGEYNSETGVWQPKAYTGSYGTNGFYLDFADNSSTTALGYDAAGSNDWTPNNFSVTAGAGNDSLVDTPTPYGTDTGVGGEVRGNYATLNPLNLPKGGTLANGNLQWTAPSAEGQAVGTMYVSSGKWYWEVVQTGTSGGCGFGIAKDTTNINSTNLESGAYVYYSNGNKYNASTPSSYGASFTTNDVIGVALDLDAGTLTFYKNGTSQGQAFSGLSGNFSLLIYDGTGAATPVYVANFGQRPFAYTAPSGFKALCTQNLPEPTVVDGSQYFDATTYTGNGTAGRVITVSDIDNVGLAWVKIRSGADDHRIANVVTGGNKHLKSNATDAESTGTNIIQAFSGNTFTVGSDLGVNSSGSTYVAWTWAANGTGVSNTAGTITSTVSANTTAGFSIVTYTGNGTNGATVGHGLGVAPKLIIVKRRTTAGASWLVYHANMAATPQNNFLVLNATDAVSASALPWNNTAPTSTVITLGTSGGTNNNTDTFVAYVFAPVEGYSAFGSYTGNGSTDGPFVYTGFRPRYVLVKCSSVSGSGWAIMDTSRIGYNVSNNDLYADLSNAEATSNYLDIVSNGFKIRSAAGDVNGSTRTYIYAAFGDSFKFALGR